MPENDEHEMEIPTLVEDLESNRNPRRRRASAPAEVGILEMPDERHDLARMVLPSGVRDSIEIALHRLEIAQQLEEVWALSRIEPNAGKCILNFFGPPGTGKTMTAGAIARRLNKPLFRVDYSAVVSKYLGDTAKQIVQAFREAAEEEAVLFFDEADSLVSKRVASGESCSTSINQNRNVLMAELERFSGVVILTTNLFQNYDPAILRRITRHVEFRLPNQKQRVELFRSHLPKLERVDADLAVVALAAKGLSGGDIRNVCLNAIYAASMSQNTGDWIVRNRHLVEEVKAVKESKQIHAEGGTPDLNLGSN